MQSSSKLADSQQSRPQWNRGHVANGLQEKAIQLYHEYAFIDAYAFSPDGKRALTSAGDKTVRLWDMETGHCLQIFKGHSDYIYGLALSADLRFALSGSVDSTVRLWDLDAGQHRRITGSTV